MLRLAIQKSGRLTDSSLALISECGIELEKYNGKLKLPAYNFPLELLLVRDDDIPQYVTDGIVDAAIVGENVIGETECSVEVIRKLGFGRCRLSLAVPRDVEYSNVQDLQGKRIATSYPKILSRFLQKAKVEASIHLLGGSVEIAPGVGIADAICDLVSSGSTLLSNGLKEVEEIFSSQAVLIKNPRLSSLAEELLNKFTFRLQAVLRARKTKYITMNVPSTQLSALCNVLPGLKSPSILPLAVEGWSSVHTVVEEDNFWELIDKLRALGAEGILVMPIEKVIG